MSGGPPLRRRMFPVADDFAAIAKRLKEIQAEDATESAEADARHQPDAEPRPKSHDVYEDTGACA